MPSSVDADSTKKRIMERLSLATATKSLRTINDLALKSIIRILVLLLGIICNKPILFQFSLNYYTKFLFFKLIKKKIIQDL